MGTAQSALRADDRAVWRQLMHDMNEQDQPESRKPQPGEAAPPAEDVLADVSPPPLPWAGVQQACMPVEDHSAALHEQELALIERAAPRRRRSFSSGRRLAQELLRAELPPRESGRRESTGVPPQSAPGPLLREAGGAPRWPAGLIGSISHSEQLAWVAVGSGDDLGLAGLGVDIEQSGRVGDKLLRRLLTPGEQAAAAAEGRDWTAYFSAKEAIYKALNPLIDRYFDFLDVELTFAGSSFKARPIKRALPERAFRLSGFCVERAGHWWGAFVVPVDWR